MHPLAIQVNGRKRLLDHPATGKARRAEHDVVGIPLPDALIHMIRSRRFIDDGAEAMRCPVAITDLNLIPILQIDAAVAARAANPKLNMETEVTINRLGHDIGCAVDTACRRRVICFDTRPAIHRIRNHRPLYRHR